MKRADIIKAARTVQGYRRGGHGSYEPVVVLSSKRLWTWKKKVVDGGNRLETHLTPASVVDTRYRAPDYGVVEIGYLVLRFSTYRGVDNPVCALKSLVKDLPEEMTEDDVEALRDMSCALGISISVSLANNAFLHGNYEELLARDQAHQDQVAADRKKLTELEGQREERFRRVLEALDAMGVDPGVRPSHVNGRTTISLDLLESLVNAAATTLD